MRYKSEDIDPNYKTITIYAKNHHVYIDPLSFIPLDRETKITKIEMMNSYVVQSNK